MMQYLLASLLFGFSLFGSVSHGAKGFSGVVQLGSHFESNVYLENGRDLGDGYLTVAPSFKYQGGSKSVGFLSTGNLKYAQYVQQAEQSHLDYELGLSSPMNQDGDFRTTLGATLATLSEPSIANKTERVIKTGMGADAKFEYDWTDLSRIRFGIDLDVVSYTDTEHLYLNHYNAMLDAFYDYKFLPETNLFIGGVFGAGFFPDGTKNENDLDRETFVKYSHTHVEGRMGVTGRLTERTDVMGYVALVLKAYQLGDNFAEPTFKLEFRERIGPKQLLLAGYDYEVADTYFSNYVVSQTMFVGYSQVLGDQVLLLVRLDSVFSSFSKPYRREDQLLAATIKAEYSYKPKFKWAAYVRSDILTSDAYYQLQTAAPEKAVNYESLKAGVTASLLF